MPITDWRIELIHLPVADVERAKQFYVDTVGFTLDHDHVMSEDVRFVQITPQGSACSFTIGKGLTEMTPGSLEGIQVVVPSAADALDHLRGRGIECSDVDAQPWGNFVYFTDPDGNGWVLQEIVRPS
ncbi:glyoxalase superfamily protein [Pseudonocardia sp. N23]|uniref:glyoxalase superfamily protein n=1 Tax=Pseudonocardia sp. N23 TaxID=1987376 RepID=UPI000BFB49DF|nr:glyoxalase superfamily protein [Pseudonocardia sp. N23]GAY08803.1 possible lyase [Pseudonocardia sp. N23]